MRNIRPEPRTAALLRLATVASVAVAAVLIVVKSGAWFLTESLSVLASLIDSVMDIAASFINLVAVRYSLKSADEDHTFGHGKAEYLAGLGQASFVAGSAIFLVLHAVERLGDPRPLSGLGAGVGSMVFAILVTVILLAVQRHVIKKTGSAAIRADSLHYLTDLFTNLSALGALALASYGWPFFDPILALVIAGCIFYSAGKIGYESVQMLMDRQLPSEVREKIRDLALSHKKVLGMHDLRTRQSGQISVVQLHLELDDQLPLAETHAIAKEVERTIRARSPAVDIIIHQDPVSLTGLSQTAGKKKSILEK